MDDHHFSYPRVVPLCGATISGHAVQAPPLPQPSVSQYTTAAPAPKVAAAGA